MSHIHMKGFPDGNPFDALTANTLNVDHIDFNTTHVSEGPLEGRMEWNNDDGTLNLGMPGGDVTLQIGQELLMRVRNGSGSVIPNGSVVCISGSSGNRPKVVLASAVSGASHVQCAMATEDLPTSQPGYVTLVGLVRGLNTIAWSAGTSVYVSDNPLSAGTLTSIPPQAPSHRIWVGVVVNSHGTQGIIYVKPSAAMNLSDLSDVDGTVPSSTNKYFVWNDTTKYWDANVIYHSGLTGLITGDDHTQYQTSARTETQITGSQHSVFSANTVYGHLSAATAYTLTLDTADVLPTVVSVDSRILNNGNFTTDASTGYSFSDYYSYTAMSAFTFTTALHASFNSEVILSGQNATFVTPEVYSFRGSIDANGSTKLVNSPVQFTFVNPSTSQVWNNGYLLVDVYGNGSTAMIAAATKMRAKGGAGSAYGYQGYATPSSSAHTGAIVGVNGYAALASNANNSYAAAVEATVLNLNSTQCPVSRRMGLKSNAHVLINAASLIVATGTSVSPDALSAQTGHLNFSGAGQLYVQGAAEFDNEVFLDQNVSNSFTSVTGTYTASVRTYILANGTFSVYLPVASGCTGRNYVIKNTGTGTITVDGNASETIDTGTTATVASLGVLRVLSDGSGWWSV